MGIAQNGPVFTGAWNTAAAAPTATFDNMPILDSTQFAGFYKVVNAGARAGPDEVAAADADAQKDNLAKVVNFLDPTLVKVGWLQFWVYMCSFGIQPEDKEYRAIEGRDETEFDKYLTKKLQSGMMSAAANNQGVLHKKKHRKFHRKH